MDILRHADCEVFIINSYVNLYFSAPIAEYWCFPPQWAWCSCKGENAFWNTLQCVAHFACKKEGTNVSHVLIIILFLGLHEIYKYNYNVSGMHKTGYDTETHTCEYEGASLIVGDSLHNNNVTTQSLRLQKSKSSVSDCPWSLTSDYMTN